MAARVRTAGAGYVVDGGWEGCAANAFLAHLAGRAFSAATVRAFASDVLNLARFLIDRDLELVAVTSAARAGTSAVGPGTARASRARPAPGLRPAVSTTTSRV